MSLAALANPRADEVFDDFVIRAGGNPVGAEVAEEWGVTGLGKGCLTVLHARAEYLWGSVWAEGEGIAAAATNAYLASLAAAAPNALQKPSRTPSGASIAQDIGDALGGGYAPSQAAKAACEMGLVKTATVVRTRDEVRDFLAAGYASFGAMAWVGYDDRPATRAAHGQSLVLSIGPDGFRRWYLADVINRGIAVSTVLGWPRCSATSR